MPLDLVKMFGHTSEISYSHRNRKKYSYKHVLGHEYFFSLLKILQSTVSNYVIFCCIRHNTFTIHVPNLITFEFLSFIKLSSQQMLKMSSTWISACMYMSNHAMSHPFKRSRGGCEWQTRVKMHWLSVSSFTIGSEYTRVSECAHR
jgi:hypothetical protein